MTQASLPLGSAGLRVEAVVAGIRSDPAFAPASFVSSGQLAFTDVDVAPSVNGSNTKQPSEGWYLEPRPRDKLLEFYSCTL